MKSEKPSPEIMKFFNSKELQKDFQKIAKIFEKKLKNIQMGTKKQKIKELEEEIESLKCKNETLIKEKVANKEEVIAGDIEQVISILKKHGNVDLKIEYIRQNTTGDIITQRNYTIVLCNYF